MYGGSSPCAVPAMRPAGHSWELGAGRAFGVWQLQSFYYIGRVAMGRSDKTFVDRAEAPSWPSVPIH